MSTHICGWAMVCDDCNRRIESDDSSVQSVWSRKLTRATPISDEVPSKSEYIVWMETISPSDAVFVPKTNVAEYVMEMEKLLPPILRKRGAFGANDGDSIDILDGVHFMGLVCT